MIERSEARSPSGGDANGGGGTPDDDESGAVSGELGDALGPPCPPKTASDLEWQRLRDAIAARAASEAGRALARELPFLPSRQAIVSALAEVREAVRLEDAGTPLPRAAAPILDEALVRARASARLSGEELAAIGKSLVAAKALRKFVRARRDEIPSLARACDSDPELDELLREIERSVEPDGGISDSASPRLAELRAERKTSRTRIVKRLEELIGRYKDLLQDAYFTEREGRYVLPVRADAHERFPGIVHSASAGGGTLFVEPRVIVPMGNRQKVLDAQVTREEDAVLDALSREVRVRVDLVEDALAALARADLRGACARLAIDLGLTFPEIPESRERAEVAVRLRRAKHPLLALDGIDVVPSDIEIVAGRALVVSGPNAGGKTVALKTVGLAALMVRAGLPVPAASESTVALFDEVLTDVGDDQSLAKNLSTFSAHVKNIAEIIDRTGVGTLVLLDELASGTDPREGEALARAVLESLVKRGGAVACTTHYEELKLVALRDAAFQNASVGFDLETMSPTFRLAMGVPGASSALAVAKRFGIPGHVVARAEEVLAAETAELSSLVARLDRDRLALDAARAETDRERDRLERERAAMDAERERLARREESALGKEADDLLADVKRAREEIRAAKAKLRSAKLDAKELAAAEKAIDQAASKGGAVEARRAGEAAKDRPSLGSGDVVAGMRVFVPRLRTDAEVLEVLANGQLRVAAGPLKLLTSVAEVRRAEGAQKSQSKKQEARSLSFDAAADPDLPIQTSDNTVDLRGLRSHEAVAIAEQFLDRCVGAGKRVAFLVHGHGTGALRQILRDALRTSPYVSHSRPGEPREGGDGVTIVWLK